MTTTIRKPQKAGKLLEKCKLLILLFFILSSQAVTANYYIDKTIVRHPELIHAVQSNNSEVLHFITHGKPGKLFLNDQWLGTTELISFFKNYLKYNQNTKQLNIYGCEFAKGDVGEKAVRSLEQALHISVSASNNLTGQGGDWNLEIGKPHSLQGLDNLPLTLQCAGTVGGTLPSDDYDGDGICNDVDVDDDNDGILDTDEYLCTKRTISMSDLGIATDGHTLSGTKDISSLFGLAAGTISLQYSNLQISSSRGMFLSNNEANDDPKNTATFQITSSKEFLLTLSHGRTITRNGRTDFFTLLTPNSYAVQAFTPKEGFDVTTSINYLSVTKNTESANLATTDASQGITWNFSQPLTNFNFTAGTTDWQGGGSGYSIELCMIADTDKDGIPNHRDLDSDDDGCPDAVEGG